MSVQKHPTPIMVKIMILVFSMMNIQAVSATALLKSPPNFLLIIADDLGIDVLNSYGLTNNPANTPNINKLSQSGVTFDNFWVTPACTTTRGALITGKHGFESGIDHVPAVMSNNSFTIQQRLKKSDIQQPYATGVFGKWHLGGKDPELNHPARFGIDHYAGNLFNVKNYNEWDLTDNGKKKTETTYHTTKVTDLAIQFIQQNKGKPWFTWLAYSAPHSPFHTPPKHLVSSQNEPNNVTDQYHLMVESMDTEIGRLLASIPAADRNNTVVIFLGDNGTPKRVRDKQIFSKDHVKGSLYEGGIKTPLIIAGGPVSIKGARENAMTNATDIFATLVDLAGGKDNIPVNSFSFKGSLDGSNNTQRAFNYSEWKTRKAGSSWTVKDATHKAIYHSDGKKELFLSSDVSEKNPINDTNKLNTLISKGNQLRSGQTSSQKIPTHNSNNHSHDTAKPTQTALSTSSTFKISLQGNKRCFTGNGLPNHDTGTFPNSGNPNQLKEQSIQLCVDANPVKSAQPNMNHRGSVGIALNGIQFRPSTADYYDASSPRGFSRDSSSGWNLEGIGARDMLGMDHQNAHVDHRGLYHYHSTSKSIVSPQSSLIGYAADGFEIHYQGNNQRSSYQLKKGDRSTAPGGRYDGKYVEDWVYQAGSGSLDQCNGGVLNGKFVYYATPTYPFFPRCFWGNPSQDFSVGRGGNQPSRPNQQQSPLEHGSDVKSEVRSTAEGQPNRMNGKSKQNNSKRQQHKKQDQSVKNGKPPRAQACHNLTQGTSCQFVTPRGKQIEGVCHQQSQNRLVCKSDRSR